MSSSEQTLSIIKPDAVERNLVEEIKNIFVKNKLNILESKKIHITKDELFQLKKDKSLEKDGLTIIVDSGSDEKEPKNVPTAQ